MFLFGSGLLWGTPLTDASGAALASPTPLIFGTLQDTEIDIKFELKQLHGGNQFAVAVGRGKGQVSGKCKLADIRAGFFETIVFGQAGSAGLNGAVFDTVGAAVPASPNTVTVAPPNAGTWAADLGVIEASTGRALTRMSSPSGLGAGQYHVAAGVYTFFAGQQGAVMYINYRYTAASTVARRIGINNLPMGYAPTFRADFYGPYQGKSAVLTLNNCISEGIKIAAKNDDFAVPEMGFQAFADQAGQVGVLSISE
jgi:hypothetical protein